MPSRRCTAESRSIPMSSRECRLKLSPRARQDFVGILRYTDETWGRAQLLIYRSLIDKALETIRVNPDIGHHHNDLPQTLWVYSFGSHVAVYRVLGDLVEVVRLLHRRMSLPLHV